MIGRMASSESASPKVLVTGASRGLGLEFCRQLLGRGAFVIAACRRPAQAPALAALLAGHPDRSEVETLDVTDPVAIAALAGRLGERHSGLDWLINNAGMLVSGERFGALAAEDLRASFECNAVGPLLLTQALTPLLARGRTPRVAMLSSILGSVGSTSEFYTPSYAISKAALNMATALLAPVLAAQGIRTVALHPGWVRTEMGGAGAQIDAPVAVAGLLRVIDGLSAGSDGGFIDYRGERLPW